jgi:hypothetical protein
VIVNTIRVVFEKIFLLSFAVGDFQAVMEDGAVFMRPCALLAPTVHIVADRKEESRSIFFACSIHGFISFLQLQSR